MENLKMLSPVHISQTLLALTSKISRWKRGRTAFTAGQWKDTMNFIQYKRFTFRNISSVLRKSSALLVLSSKDGS